MVEFVIVEAVRDDGGPSPYADCGPCYRAEMARLGKESHDERRDERPGASQ